MPPAGQYARKLAADLGADPSPEALVDALVPEAADLVQLFVRVSDELRLVAFRHIDPGHHPALAELAAVHHPPIHHPTDPVAQVLRNGKPRLSNWVRRQHVEQVTLDRRVHAIFDVLQPRSIVLVPLSRANSCYGVLVSAFSASGRQFDEGDLEFMTEFAAHVAAVLRLPETV
jgi:GAF domain-containing protein